MTISDEPDEDADTLDDDDLLGRLIRPDTLTPVVKANAATDMPDWPPAETDHFRVALGNKTIAWFKANHADWAGQIDAVLRAWVAAHEQKRGATPP